MSTEQNNELSSRYETDYEIGEDNIHIMGMDLHNPVFIMSTLLIFLFVVGTLIFPDVAKQTFDSSKDWAINNFDWFFMLGGNIFVVFCIALILSPFGRIRIGGQTAKPEFSTLSWLSMLFAAGMGIGLMFWSVAEPVGYFTNWAGAPLNVAAETQQAAQLAMGATMYHWGLHPWAIYAVVGLSLAFFAFNCNMPLTIRSTFYPIFGERVWGTIGNLIDTIAVLATIFGLATSLGFGAQQAAGGLSFLFGINPGILTQLIIITAVTLVAVGSVMRGLDGGVKILSNINISLAGILMVFVIIAGSTSLILNGIGSTLMSYMSNIIPLSNLVGREDQNFIHTWTIFYWAWWISWSPFVGMFIARISKGRTVRQFLFSVLIVPTLITSIWMSTFGLSGIEQVKNNVGELANGITNSSLTLFQMLDSLPFGQITSFLAIILVLVFFITSSDSGSLVIDSITAGGKINVPVGQRIYWAVMEGVIAGTLLFGGGSDALGALQAAAITVGLPFTLVLLTMCVSLFMGLLATHKMLKAETKPIS